jgi:FkbM family methyltransferase
MMIFERICKKVEKVFFCAIAMVLSVFGIGFTSRLANALNKTLRYRYNDQQGETVFYTPNALALWRAKTFLTKEPDTIEWMNGFDDNEVFWDIGANVGCYTLYAGAMRSIKTMAFEPSPANFPLLVKNIELNQASDIVSAFPIALSNKTQIADLNMTTTDAATAHSTFGENRNQFGQDFTPVYKHTMIGYSVDDFIKQFECDIPNHIKIDVDGIEDLIIEGAQKTLKNTAVKSVLIELNIEPNDYDQRVISMLVKAGFKISQTRECGSGIANFIFTRQD